jgi:hypothetical protein
MLRVSGFERGFTVAHEFEEAEVAREQEKHNFCGRTKAGISNLKRCCFEPRATVWQDGKEVGTQQQKGPFQGASRWCFDLNFDHLLSGAPSKFWEKNLAKTH